MIGSDLRAPEAEIRLSDGSRSSLGEYFKNGPLVLVFLRHLG